MAAATVGRRGATMVATNNSNVCKFWLSGCCARNPCKFLHTSNHAVTNSHQVVCDYWVKGNCVYGENCRFLHSWSKGDNSFSILTRLGGHKRAVTGIALPTGFDKLYSGARDGTVRIWDCNSGECIKVINNLGSEVGCLISEGNWVFIGLKNLVKAWNVVSGKEFDLVGRVPVGQVYALEVSVEDGMLFAGGQYKAITAWKYNPEMEADNCRNPFVFVKSLQGHTEPVVSLIVGKRLLYSGSMDGTIRVWDEKLQCVNILEGHSDTVTSLICWTDFLLLGSLDGTVRIWANGEKGLHVYYTHREEEGIVSLCGLGDADDKPVLCCSCKDNSVHLYDLPSFAERGMIFTRKEIQAIRNGPGGLFFSGDGNGVVSVWQWKAKPSGEAS